MRKDCLTHLDQDGRARMVDVSRKPATTRTAVAEGAVRMHPDTRDLAQQGGTAKGDVGAIAELAGIMAAKKTSDLIPLCHPLPLSSVSVRITFNECGVSVRATCRTTGQTGVEMEALTAVSAACLTIYDMLKAVDRGMEITGITLREKSGGQSGDWSRESDA